MENVKKVAVKVWQPALDKFNKKIEIGCLRRDAYVNEVLAIELDRLDEEIAQANSDAARDFVTAQLNQLNRKVVTFSLRAELVDRLDEICNKKIIARDAFFNRILLLLAAAPAQIDKLFCLEKDWQKTVWDAHLCDFGTFSEVFYPLEPHIDPFFVIREGIRLNNLATDQNISFYRFVLTDKHFKNAGVMGLNCYLPDELVPNTFDWKRRELLLDEL